MSQELVATFRVHYFYQVGSHSHELTIFCKAQQTSGSWELIDRDPAVAAIPWEDGANRAGGAICALLPSSVASLGNILLEQRSGIMWNAVDSTVPTVQPGVNSLVPYSQFTLTMRDTAFNKVRWIVLETNQAIGYQLVSPTGGDTQADLAIAEWTGSDSNANDPFRWAVSKSNHYLHTNSFVSVSTWTNYHLTPR